MAAVVFSTCNILFLLCGVVLLIAMVGTIILTLVYKDKKKQQNIMLQNLRKKVKYKLI